jgi:hypothetical protein
MNYLPRLVSNYDPPNSASQVARIIGVSHQHPGLHFLLYTNPVHHCLKLLSGLFTPAL